MQTFQELEVWKRGCDLSVALFLALKGSSHYSFADQVTRSALSIPSNIAEGYERTSRPDYVRMLRIAKGSCAELRTQLHIGSRAGLLDAQEAEQWLDEAEQLNKMLQAMINKLA